MILIEASSQPAGGMTTDGVVSKQGPMVMARDLHAGFPGSDPFLITGRICLQESFSLRFANKQFATFNKLVHWCCFVDFSRYM